MSMTKGSRRVTRAGLGALAALILMAPSVLAESGFSDAVTLRKGPSGAGVQLEDVAAKGRQVSVVWEEFIGGDGVLRLRTSTDGGATFRSQRLVEDREGGRASTDVCVDHAWVAHSYRLPGDPLFTNGLIVGGFPLSVAGGSGELIVGSGGSQWVDETDFTCVGSRRRAVAWVDRDFKTTSTVRVRFIPIHADIKGEAPADLERSFRADAFTSVALAARGTRAWLAWQTINDRIRIKAFDVGPGPDFTVTPRPTHTLPDAGTATGRIEMAAVGSKLVIAYGIRSNTFVRVSTNGGASFGPRKRLLRGIFGGDLHTTPLSADIRGSRVVVHAAELGGFKDLETIAYRFVSTDLGGTWRGVRRYSDGSRMGAFAVRGRGTRLVEAWDRNTSTRDRKPVRFHRQL